MSSLDLTRDWLKSVLRPYASRDRLQQEVLDVLGKRRTLSVKTDAFTFDNGQTALLLLLHGTLPINFRGATYQIPVHIWFPHDYPRSPPLAFVVPTKDMGVRKSREVEPGGKVNDEVIAQWWASWDTKSIIMLLEQLTSIFSATPPLYSKPATEGSTSADSAPRTSQPAPAQGMQNGDRPPPPPARPAFGPPGVQETLPQYRPGPTPPPHPFPQQIVTQPTHQRQFSGSYSSPGPSQYPGQSPNSPQSYQPPPIPTRVAQPPPRPMSQGPVPGSPGGPAPPSRPYMPRGQVPGQAQYGPGPGPVLPQQPMTPPRIPLAQSQPGPSHTQWNVAGPSYTPPPAFSSAQPPHPPPQSYQSQWQAQNPSPHPGPSQMQPHALGAPPVPFTQPASQPAVSQPPRQRHDLLSSPDDTYSPLPSDSPVQPRPESHPTGPPPVPPSKPPPPSLLHLHSILLPHLNATLPPLVDSLQHTRQHLIERKEDLESGEPAIRDEMARLEAVKKVCDSVGRKMDEAVSKGSERVAELEARGEVSVDELVCGISIVHNQLIDLVAEDNAIEDTIYHLTRALDSERIDLDKFLKSIRSLGREQYLKRALIERILQGMGQGQTW